MAEGNTLRAAVEQRKEVKAQQEPDTGGAVLELSTSQTWWTPRQLAALKALGIRNASSEDLLIFLHYCGKTGLDPFSKQIYLIERRMKEGTQWVSRQVIQVGIDGFRVQAQRAAARQEVSIEYEPTIWFDEGYAEYPVWLGAQPPAAAMVTVVKVLPDGLRLRYPGVARFDSYAARGVNKETGEAYLQGQWATMPDHMVEKCAEAFALRRAFPNDLSGQYAEEELQYQYQAPPKLPARRRDPQPDDDWVTEGQAEDSAEPSERAQSAGASRGKALAKMHAIFREYGMGARNQRIQRTAVITGLLQDSDTTPSKYVTVSVLSPEAASYAADALSRFCEEHGENAREALRGYAAAISDAVEGEAEAEAEETPE